MADIIKTATRDAYGKALIELGHKDKNVIVMDSDLAEATRTGKFKKEFPDRFFDSGIAECDMMCIAAVIPYLQVRLQCSLPGEPLSKSETLLLILISMLKSVLLTPVFRLARMVQAISAVRILHLCVPYPIWLF